MREREYYREKQAIKDSIPDKCLKRTEYRKGRNINPYPTCQYLDINTGKCSAGRCIRYLKPKGAGE